MRLLYGALALTAGTTYANIIFPKVQPTCDSAAVGFSGCLRGQLCTTANVCKPARLSRATETSASPPRDDNRCGRDFDNAPCDADTSYGGCCSQHGYCGSSESYCLASFGCQSGCAEGRASSTKSTSPDVHTSGEPVLGTHTSSGNRPAQTGPATEDGTCGARRGNTVCGDWPKGACCSMYGMCGNTTSHCGDGCQSGPCLGGAAVAGPAAKAAPRARRPGSFEIVGESGVAAMHAALMPNGRVIFLDKVENYTQVKLGNGQYAPSTEYDPRTNKYVPLSYKTNAFCSGGTFLPDGRVISVGGNGPLLDFDPTVGNGLDGIRYLKRSSSDSSLNGKVWSEPGNKLASHRWYASAQTLGDGSVFVASGSLNARDPTNPENNNPTYEILDANGVTNGENVKMDILVKNQPYYMYPFLHLLRDGSMFVFVSKSAEIFQPKAGKVVRRFPDLPGDYRTYPNTGGSVLLPLSSASNWDPDVIICGGGAYQDIDAPTDPSCGRIQPLAPNAKWEMDSMPEGRGMVEGTLLPDGTVLWLNGCGRGSQGFGLGADPTLEALFYNPNAALGKRWSTGAKSTIPRLYHSVALLLLDGTVMVAGSNPNQQPILKASEDYPYPTEYRVEIYTPPYLQGDRAQRRPTQMSLSSKTLSADGSTFTISFNAPEGAKAVKVALHHNGFVTHSLHMGHRMLFLDTEGWRPGSGQRKLTVTMPPNSRVAPPGPYVVYVVVDGTPGVGQFVQVA